MRTTPDTAEDLDELDESADGQELLDEVREVKSVLADMLKAALATKAPAVNVTHQAPDIRVPATTVNESPRPKSATIISHRPDGSQVRYEITFNY